MSDAVISVRGLRKSYGDREAVRGIDLDVQAGEVFAFLGPNGAGKTTTVEILEGYRGRTAGDVSVFGVDPARPTRAWRERVGIVLQASAVSRELTARETVAQFAGYYPRSRDVDETLDLVGLGDSANVRASRLSGGQHRRLDVALALVGDPDLLFLDEPTTGFDPSARRSAWTMISDLKLLGKTIFLTTHYMDEAQELADRIAIISDGRIIADGTPATIGGRATAATVIRFRLPPDAKPTGLARAVGAPTEGGDGRFSISTSELVKTLHSLTSWAIERKVDLVDLSVDRPSLEDVYLSLTEES